ncbi:GSCOCG00013464001-RA-CDS [Cotesia congregata]|nr:GSCOCG00013464001-RA-CDS [Cotesia congregata]
MASSKAPEIFSAVQEYQQPRQHYWLRPKLLLKDVEVLPYILIHQHLHNCVSSKKF